MNKKFLSVILALFLIGVASAADKSIVYDTTTKGIKTSDPLPVANGGTGSAIQNFADLTTNQTINGTKTFTTIPVLPASDPTADNQAVKRSYCTNATNLLTGTVPTARLGSGTANNTTYLRGDQSFQPIVEKNTSNVIFSWSGCEEYGSRGLILGSDLTIPDLGSGTGGKTLYAAVYGSSARTILVSKFKKIAGISTVTIQGKIWSPGGDTVSAILAVDIGGQSNSVNSGAATTPTWATSSDIDVSGLTDDQVYDITITLKCESVSPTATVGCSAVALIAS